MWREGRVTYTEVLAESMKMVRATGGRESKVIVSKETSRNHSMGVVLTLGKSKNFSLKYAKEKK